MHAINSTLVVMLSDGDRIDTDVICGRCCTWSLHTTFICVCLTAVATSVGTVTLAKDTPQANITVKEPASAPDIPEYLAALTVCLFIFLDKKL